MKRKPKKKTTKRKTKRIVRKKRNPIGRTEIKVWMNKHKNDYGIRHPIQLTQRTIDHFKLTAVTDNSWIIEYAQELIKD